MGLGLGTRNRSRIRSSSGRHLIRLGLGPPQPDQLGQPVRIGLGQVVALGEVRLEVVQLPSVVVEGGAGRVVGHRLPAGAPDRPVAEHLEVLHRFLMGAAGSPTVARETRSLDGHLRHAAAVARRIDADEIQHRRDDVDGVRNWERIDPASPRLAGQARMSGSRIPPEWVFCLYRLRGVLLTWPHPIGYTGYVADRRCRRASATSSADVLGGQTIDPAEVVDRPHAPPSRVAPLSERSTSRVLSNRPIAWRKSSSRPIWSSVWSIIAGVDLLEPGAHRPLVGAQVVPGRHPGVAGRQLGTRRYDAELDLAGQDRCPAGVPAAVEAFRGTPRYTGRRVQRRMRRPEAQVEEVRLLGQHRHLVAG